jgi:hypothetical protein
MASILEVWIDRQTDRFLWMSRRELKGKTESEVIATQDQAMQSKYHATKILQTVTDRKCRL